ncbi:MAG: hypoxanthine phosphoribosyltransferase [Clostridia bacterium]|nr:hypoxanthine phosphoribosyltransferase [Clostridia bacterium]
MRKDIHPDIKKILFSEEDIKNIVEKTAAKINEDYKDEEITVVVILRGSMVFAADLIRCLNMPVTVEFMQASSYGSSTSSTGFINIKRDLDADIEGKNVLIIEDIIDSGNTLFRLKNVLEDRKPKSCNICTLLDKPERRVTDVEVKYVGAIIPDEFVVGYGLDYDEHYRNLPYIGVLKEEIYQ